jgi:hypothetical protein
MKSAGSYEGRPGAQVYRVAEHWLEHVPQKWDPVLRQGYAQTKLRGLFDIVKIWAPPLD